MQYSTVTSMGRRLLLIAASLSTVLWMVLTWMPWIRFLGGRTCILLWILYGNMVDFSFIVSLYVSDLPNVTRSTSMGTRDNASLLPGISSVVWHQALL